MKTTRATHITSLVLSCWLSIGFAFVVHPSTNARVTTISIISPLQASLADGDGMSDLDDEWLQFQDEQTTKLILGSHELKGTIGHLKHPFCVFEKDRSDNNGSNLQYRVTGVVTKKLLFNNYPKTIMRS